MKTYLLVITAILGLLGVIFGALGAHALKKILDAHALESFHTAVRYQMFHVLAILALNALPLHSFYKNTVALTFLIGILFFSGSIYLITAGINPRSIWFVTPLGGMIFMAGWALLAWGLYKS